MCEEASKLSSDLKNYMRPPVLKFLNTPLTTHKKLSIQTMKWSGKLNQNLIIWKIYRGILYIKYRFKYSNNVIMLIS